MASPPAAAGETAATATRPCPRCKALSSGRFCAECGTTLDGARCGNCRTELSAGAKFCHRCGYPAGAERTGDWRGQNVLPWSIAGIALLALVSLLAGQRLGRSSDGSSVEANPPAATAGAPGMTGGPGGGGRPPDLSTMSPDEQRTRLYDRVMSYAERNMADSLSFWAGMAIVAYESLGPLDLDGHYDLGRLGEVSGDLDLAASQADTVLRREPNHLLGLALAARTATARKDAAAARRFWDRLIAAEPSERGKDRREYKEHANDLTRAVDEARRATGGGR